MKQVTEEGMCLYTLNIKFNYAGTVEVRASSPEQAKQIVKEDLQNILANISNQTIKENANGRIDPNKRSKERLSSVQAIPIK